ncbi:MAG: amidohydrolase [Lentisphaeria bacterium]|nr:amidohydrolase [Lentisphaeria bacterium]
MDDAMRKKLLASYRGLRVEAEATALRLGELAELPMREVQSAALLREVLCAHGFRIEREFELIPNAFIAAAGRGRPVVGILAEYDALPDCGVDGRSPGHGCGHNLLGTASTFAAIALARVLEANSIRGTVKLFGCPAEETLVGKVYMARDGAFGGLDACLAWHPSTATNVDNGSGAAMDSIAYEFFGKTAHAAADPHNGRSALDAVEIMNVAVNFLREHIPSNVRIHYAIMDGGKAPNVVPPYARSWYYIRGRDREQVKEISERVDNCARGAALATDTEMRRSMLAACYDRLPNEALSQALDRSLHAVGAPRFSAADRATAAELGLKNGLSGEVGAIRTGRGTASSDEANVSWLAPLGRLNTACWAKGTPGHHLLVHRQAQLPAAMKGMAVAIKTLSLTGLDLMTDPDLRRRAKSEFRKLTKGTCYDPVIPIGQPAPIQDRLVHRSTTDES